MSFFRIDYWEILASLIAQLIKNHLQCWRSQLDSWSGRFPGEGIGYLLQYSWASLVTQEIQNLTVVWENWIQSLDWEDPLEEGMATHSSILPGESPWTEEPGRLQSIRSQRVGHNWATKDSTQHIEKFRQLKTMDIFLINNQKEAL